MKLGKTLREFREGAGLTQIQVAALTSVAQTSLSQIESDKKNPSAKTLKKLCEIYGVPPQIAVFKSLTEKDVPKKKVKLFRDLKPVIDSLIEEILKK